MPTHNDDYDLSVPSREELVEVLRRNGYNKVEVMVKFRMDDDVEPFIFRMVMHYLYAHLREEISSIEAALNR